MLNCKDVSKLVSESLDRKLPLWKRANLWMHLCMCRLCWRFRRDINHLHGESRHIAEHVELDTLGSDVKLSAESRERMKRILASNQS